MKHPWLFSLGLVALLSTAVPATSRAIPSSRGGPAVRNVQLGIRGPGTVRLGEPIMINVSVRSTTGQGQFVEYGSLDLVQFHATDANSHPLPERYPLGVTILPHSYLPGEDNKSIDLRRYVAVERPGIYTVKATLPRVIFYGAHHDILLRSALSSNTITINVTP